MVGPTARSTGPVLGSIAATSWSGDRILLRSPRGASICCGVGRTQSNSDSHSDHPAPTPTAAYMAVLPIRQSRKVHESHSMSQKIPHFNDLCEIALP